MADGGSLDWESLSPSDATRVEESLERWEQGRREGELPEAQDVCDVPELLPFVADRIRLFSPVPTASQTAASLPETLPETIGPFQLTGVVSRGSRCSVYKGFQSSPRREVAIKVLHKGAGDEQVTRRFLLESQILATLDHPAIARVYTAGVFEHAGRKALYYVMEYVSGPSLIKMVRSRGLDRTQRVVLFAKICDAVTHAHRNGVIHRDLKPSNILTTPEGEPKLLDFGIARLMGLDAFQAARGKPSRVSGTPTYMSPEQYDVSLREDTRTDIYSLGVILFELLTFKLPYARPLGSVDQAARLVQSGKLVSLAIIDPTCPRDLAAIVHKCLQTEPDDRYQDVGLLSSDLQSYLEGEFVSARPPGLTEQVFRWTGKHRLAVAAAMASLLLLLTSGIVSFTLWRRSERNAAQLATTVGDLREAEQAISTEVVLRRRSTFNNILTNADSAWRHSPDVVRSWLLDEQLGGLAPKAFAWKMQLHRSRRTSKSFKAHTGQVAVLACSPSCELIASHGLDDRLKCWSSETGTLRWSRDCRLTTQTSLAFHPHGGQLLFVEEGGRVVIADAKTGETQKRMQVFADGARGATYSNTGDAIIVWNDASRVVVYDASAESELHAATMEGTSKISAVFADSGSGFLYVVALDGLVTRWDLTADRIESQWRIPKLCAHRVAMGPGFRFMAFSHQFDVLRIDDLLDPDPPIDAMATGEKLDRLAFTQDSRFLISAGRSRVTARARSTAWATDWIRDFECPVTSLCVATSDNSYAIGFEDGTVSLCHIAPLPLFHPIAKELIRPRMMVLDSAEGAVWTVGASLDRLDLASSERQSFPLTGDRDYLAIAGPMNQRVFISGRSEPIIYAVSESDREPRPFITTRNRIRSLAADERRNVLYSGDFKGNFEAWMRKLQRINLRSR